MAAAAAPQNTNIVSTPLDQKVEQLRKQSLADFQKLMERFPLNGLTGTSKEWRVAAVQRTNSDGSVKVEVGIQSDSYQASFVAGPLSPDGRHVNPFLPDGPLLNLFYSLYDGSDTRRKPEAADEWYRSTGEWSEEEAVAQTMTLLDQLGIPASRILKHRFRPSTLTVKNPAGESVRVTPFYRVDVYDKPEVGEDAPGFLHVEYRIDQSPPGKVTRLFIWPPIKVP